ncbi:restriction endonuclease [Fructobacillus cardui]|uniref:Restriction endonuclease Mrr (Mrr) n=1 Tax=Fructobacillus cardui TaxID=2893170 RepID=A0ABN9YT61_9LACO|nr:Restriction endonuclease Mrr (Mrr) [Fructobacillus cardui]
MKDDLKAKKHVKSAAKEGIVMMALLQMLQNAGGKMEKKSAKNMLPQMDDRISDEMIQEEKVSKKTGTTYRPFNFIFNFAVKRLQLFDCIENSRGKFLILTEKGMELDLSQTSGGKIRAATDALMKELSEKNKKKKETQTLVENPKNRVVDPEPEDDDSDDISDSTESWKEELKVQLRKMDPNKFEKFSRRLIQEMGAQIDDEIGVKLSQDHGLDGYAYFVSDELRTTRVAIQSKRYNNQVGDKYIRDFRGSIQNGTDYGILITTDYFTPAAVKEAKDPSKSTPITLLDLDDVVDLVEKHQLFVKRVETYELGDFYFE